MFGKLKGLPPHFWVSVTLIFMTLYSCAAYFSMTQRPWLGVRFVPDIEAQGLVVDQVFDGGPATGVLTQGDKISAIVLSDGGLYYLYPKMLEEPNNLQTYEEFNQLVQAQDVLWSALHYSSITFVRGDGRYVVLTPFNKVPLSAIPVVYWGYAIIPPMAVLVGLLVLLRNSSRLEAILFQVNGFSYYLTVMMTMSFSRELAMAPDMMVLFAFFENIGTNLFSATLLVMLLTFPAPLVSIKSALCLGAGVMLFPVNSLLQVIELPFHTFLVHFLILKPAFLGVGVRQWFKSEHLVKNRAIIKWILLSLITTLSIAFPAFVVPTVMGYSPFLPVESARLVIAVFYVGMALAIARYRLFDVERWWFRFFTWLVGGILVIAFDAGLVLTLHLSPLTALSGALILAGFVYFPLRQWLLGFFIKESRSRLQQGVKALAASITKARSDAEFESGWRQVLDSQFLPGVLQPLAVDGVLAGIHDDGLSIVVPSIDKHLAYKLQGKHRGRQLFSPEDVSLVSSLLEVARTSRDSARAREEAARAERCRIMEDLHDSVGAKLLTMIHRAEAPEFELAARDALETLRDTVRFSVGASMIVLEELVADLRAENGERVSDFGTPLRWEAILHSSSCVIEPALALTLTHVMRESISNAMRHAKPTYVSVLISSSEKVLVMSITNDGVSEPFECWQHGFGIQSMIKRMSGVAGRLIFSSESGNAGVVTLRCDVPLNQYLGLEGGRGRM